MPAAEANDDDPDGGDLSASDSEEGEARARWESLVGNSKLARQTCTCGLIPCLCASSGADVWLSSTELAAVSPETRSAPAAEGLVLNPEEPCTSKRRHLAASLSRVLKPHQVEGVRYLWRRTVAKGGRGCILADHMGLGKTLQVIAVLSAYFAEDNGASPSTAMVVAPAFVLSNWLNEFARWAPDDERLQPRCLPASGSRGLRIESLGTWRREGGTLLVGYEMFRQLVTSADAGSVVLEALCDPGPGLVVLDEAHRLKEPKSQLYRALRRVKTSRRLLVSGYPVQNRLDEYFALVDFARPGALGGYECFKAFFERPIAAYIETCEAQGATSLEDGKLALRRAFALQHALQDVVLRRGNVELGAELPMRRDWLVHCELSATQAALYGAFEQSVLGANAEGELASYHTALAIVNHPDIVHAALRDEELLFEEGPHAKRPRFDDDEDAWIAPETVAAERRAREERHARDEVRRVKLRRKLAARIVSSVARARFEEDDLEAAALSAAGNVSLWAAPVLRPLATAPAAGGRSPGYSVGQASGRCGSGKATVALELLAAVTKRGERAILFTQTLGTLDVLERLIESRNGRAGDAVVRYKRIDGATAPSTRTAIVEAFNRWPTDDQCDVLLMSIKAGGEGINLVGASRVILFDICWNPCFDQQALCRAHRFGQRLPVHVYRLVGPKNTMEARVLRQQRRKELLVREVADVGTVREATGRHFLDAVYDKHQADLATPDAVDDVRPSHSRSSFRR